MISEELNARLQAFRATIIKIVSTPQLSHPYHELDEAGRQAYCDMLGVLFEAYLDEALQAYQHTVVSANLSPQAVSVFAGISSFMMRLTAELAVGLPDDQQLEHVQRILDNVNEDFTNNYMHKLKYMRGEVANAAAEELKATGATIQ